MLVVRVPGDLPGERRPLSRDEPVPLGEEARAAIDGVVRGGARGAVVEADNLEALAAMPDGCVDLAYADPPFATGKAQRLVSIRSSDGAGEPTRTGFRGKPASYEAVSDLAWDDDLPLDEHLAALEARVREVHRVLAPHGSLYLHVDWRTVHHVRLLLDRVFGAERFLNELVWAYDYGGRARDRWPRKHDTILWYAKGPTWRFERDAIDRVPYLAPGLVGPEKAARGKLPTDVWWMTIVPPASAERTGYPTQKPVRLLERIVAASSRPGELVLDPYAGSGTTGVAAARLGRRWLLVDRNPEAVAIARRRLEAERMTIEAITFDFGNTLVPVPAAGLRGVVAQTADRIADRAGPVRPRRRPSGLGRGARAPVPRGGSAVPRGRPVAAPGPDPRPAARHARARAGCALGRRGRGRLSSPAEVAWAVEVYSRAFVTSLPPAPAAGAVLATLAARYRLAILSNWPLAATIDRYVEAAGWAPHLAAVVVSQRVGTIKPHPAIFAAARAALGDPEPSSILHVGDDWAADVVGAKRVGWRAALVASRPDDSPLPGSPRDDEVEVDLELATLDELEAGLELLT